MKRSPARAVPVLLTILVSACASGPPRDGGGGLLSPPGPGHVNVIVTCRDQDRGAGIKVVPWTVHTQADSVYWHVAGKPLPLEVSAADPAEWPFPETSYKSSSGRIEVKANPGAQEGRYHYVVTIRCPDKVITIDPDIMLSQ
jgi:hypothetical protein